MRIVSLLKTINEKEDVDNKNNYNGILYNKYSIINNMIDKSDNKINKKIIPIIHPFENIKNKICSSFIPNNSIKITNAFMKMYEILMFIDNSLLSLSTLFTGNELLMYDIASFPGMFILSTENYLKNNYQNITLNFHGCSYIGSTALSDAYGLYKINNNRFSPCDLSNIEDINKCIMHITKKYKLVTGDVGTPHDNNSVLQEVEQYTLIYNEAIMGTIICDIHGIMLFKMYSLVFDNSINLLNMLTLYYENVYITKPYTSRILNNECYVICVNRNDRNIDISYFYQQNHKNYNSNINKSIITSFENNRLEIKYKITKLIYHIYKYNPDYKICNYRRCNIFYDEYYKEMEPLYNTLLDITNCNLLSSQK